MTKEELLKMGAQVVIVLGYSTEDDEYTVENRFGDVFFVKSKDITIDPKTDKGYLF